MKKFTILILIITISFFRMGIISRADTEIIYYDLQWTNNVSWDLETGVFDSLDYRYSVSNRLKIKDYFDMVWVDNTNFHHLLIFDGANRLIGYYNSVYTNIQTSKYLGVYNTGITLPANAVKFAFMNYTGSNEVEIWQLDNYTLNELFETIIYEDYLVFKDPYFKVVSNTQSEGTISSTSNTVVNTWLVPSTSYLNFYDTSMGNIFFRVKFSRFGEFEGDYNRLEVHINSYWSYVSRSLTSVNAFSYPVEWNTNYDIMLSETTLSYLTSYPLRNIGVDLVPVQSTNYKYIIMNYFFTYSLTRMRTDKIYSTLYQTTFDLLTDAQMKEQMIQWLDNPIAFLGIQLPQTVIDEYKLLYEYNTTQTDYTQTFTPEVYEAVNPFYYRYFDPNLPPPEPFSFTTFINNMFNFDGFDESLIQMIISAIIIGGALFVMAMYKASGLLMIIVAVISYTGLAIIGWLPQAPILIMALGLVALIIIKLVKGGGGGDEE